MPKKIVLLLDGTSNEISKKRSNVMRLYGTLEKSDEQVVYYDPGVGSLGAANAWSRNVRKVSEVWGMATGWGLDANVKEAYTFLVQNYETYDDGTADSIYIFGFSRGAYTARVLAGFLHAFGLLEERSINLLDYAYRAFKAIGSAGEKSSKNDFEELWLYDRTLRPQKPVIRMLGLFDTVASVIESGRLMPRLRKHAYTSHNPSVEAVRHAVSIHERRTMFRPQLWPGGQTFHPHRFATKGAKPQDAREVWFTGVHGDVGGGYPEEESALAKFTLYWMIEESKGLGLTFRDRTVTNIVLGKDKEKDYSKPDVMAKMHDSMSGAWKALEFIPRRTPPDSTRKGFAGWSIPRSDWRYIPPGALLHRSVVERFEAKGPFPPNVPADHGIAEEHMPPD
jgi:uncharacterized protein (DUF2235 family)